MYQRYRAEVGPICLLGADVPEVQGRRWTNLSPGEIYQKYRAEDGPISLGRIYQWYEVLGKTISF